MTEPLAKATLSEASKGGSGGGAGGHRVRVHFNPETLQLSYRNALSKNTKQGQATQYIQSASSTLSVDLVFDTTVLDPSLGAEWQGDVRKYLAKLRYFLTGSSKTNKGDAPKKKAAPVCVFEWGSFVFRGVCESYQETLELFAPTGVPLRAKVSLSLASQEIEDLDRDTGWAPPPLDIDPDITG